MNRHFYASEYLESIGVSSPTPSTVAFDPGYAPLTLQSHIEQSCHLLYGIKLSMATWQISSRAAVESKINSIHQAKLPAIAGGGPFEIAANFNEISPYMDLCAKTGFDRIEIGEGFAASINDPRELIRLAVHYGLTVQYELGEKFKGPFEKRDTTRLRDKVRAWIYAGAEQLVIEAREDALQVGLFNASGDLNRYMADALLDCVDGNLRYLQFEAPTKKSQFALIEHFGHEVILSNVRLEEILRVEIFRLGLHSKSFSIESLRPRGRIIE